MAEFMVAHVNDLVVGEMKQVRAGETDVLLARIEGGFHAVGAYCTHYSAPLAAGGLCGERVVCPWHHACFSVRNGEMSEPPGLDHLPVYGVRIEQDEIWVEVPEASAKHRLPEPVRRHPADTRTCVVMGAGCAGAYAVESLRGHGYGGRVVWVTDDEFPPIDRPNLSKEYLSGEAPEEWLPLRTPDFYAERDIEVMAEKRVVAVDADERRITLDKGEVIRYDSAVLATGASVRHLDVPGAGLAGVYSLHSLADSRRLNRAAANAHKAVVVGAGFIGLEAAQSLRKRDMEVTVIGPETVPFERVLGTEVGTLMRNLHEENGVVFRLGHTVHSFEGDEVVRQVKLDDGSVLEADLVIVGVGVRPVTDFVEGVEKGTDGSVLVNECMEAAPGLYAAGDLVRFPDWRTGEAIRVEHWRVAAQHGRLAGANAAGASLPYRGVPYFWTRQFGHSLHYLGHAQEWDEIRFTGKLDQKCFIAYYLKKDKVHAVVGMERERELAILEERIRREGLFTADIA